MLNKVKFGGVRRKILNGNSCPLADQKKLLFLVNLIYNFIPKLNTNLALIYRGIIHYQNSIAGYTIRQNPMLYPAIKELTYNRALPNNGSWKEAFIGIS